MFSRGEHRSPHLPVLDAQLKAGFETEKSGNAISNRLGRRVARLSVRNDCTAHNNIFPCPVLIFCKFFQSLEHSLLELFGLFLEIFVSRGDPLSYGISGTVDVSEQKSVRSDQEE